MAAVVSCTVYPSIAASQVSPHHVESTSASHHGAVFVRGRISSSSVVRAGIPLSSASSLGNSSLRLALRQTPRRTHCRGVVVSTRCESSEEATPEKVQSITHPCGHSLSMRNTSLLSWIVFGDQGFYMFRALTYCMPILHLRAVIVCLNLVYQNFWTQLTVVRCGHSLEMRSAELSSWILFGDQGMSMSGNFRARVRKKRMLHHQTSSWLQLFLLRWTSLHPVACNLGFYMFRASTYCMPILHSSGLGFYCLNWYPRIFGRR